MNRIDRLTALLIHIQGRKRTSIDALEERFSVSRRTLFRDIRALIEGGVPIGGDAGEGYFIVDGYHLPPVVFNKEEAGAILTGFKLIEQHGDHKTSKTFEEALYKVKAVLRYRDREFLERLENQVSILPSPRRALQPMGDLYIEELQYALASERVILMSYLTPYSEKASERHVEPLGLVNYSGKWHLIAYCRLRKAMRDFRTDRIQKLSITQESFNPKEHPDYLEFLVESLSGENLVEVVVSFTKMVGRLMGDQKYYFGFIEEVDTGDRLEMKFYVNHLDYFARWLLSFGNQVDIISPKALSTHIQELILELNKHHR